MPPSHNMADYDRVRDEFAWEDVYDEAEWDAPERLNVAHEVCDRHAENKEKVALYQVSEDGGLTTLTFWELAERTNRFANVLESLGIEAGDRVFSYMPRIPDHYVALLGTLKRGAVFGGINERFGPEGISYRLDDCAATAIVTTPENRDTVADALDDAASVEHVIVVSDDGTGIRRGDVSLRAEMETASREYDPAETGGEDDALLYYTSGTTGLAKGVLHKHRWVAGVAATQKYAVDLQEGDCYWSTGDLGWLTGLINTLGAWYWGTALFTYEGEFDPEEWEIGRA